MAVSVACAEAEEALPVAVWVVLEAMEVAATEAETLPTAMRPAAMDVSVRSAR